MMDAGPSSTFESTKSGAEVIFKCDTIVAPLEDAARMDGGGRGFTPGDRQQLQLPFLQ